MTVKIRQAQRLAQTGQHGSRSARLQLVCERGKDIFAGEDFVENAYFILPTPPHKAAGKEIKRSVGGHPRLNLRGHSANDARKNGAGGNSFMTCSEASRR